MRKDQPKFTLKTPKSASPAEKVAQRQRAITSEFSSKFEHIFQIPFRVEEVDSKNCDNLIGSVTLPLGVAGPMMINISGNESVLLPLATTEGALVASINRGCKAVTLAGGAKIIVENKGMTRAPVFKCQSRLQAKKLGKWFEDNLQLLAGWAAETSQHLELMSLKTWIHENLVYVRFAFDTDQAMGMNMATIASQHIWQLLEEKINVGSGEKGEVESSSELNLKDLRGISLLSISSNLCTDKKPSQVNLEMGRGYWVTAVVVLSERVVSQVLKSNVESIVEVHQAKNVIGSCLAGTAAGNMQAANAVAAIFAATGQDLAHVVEGSQTTTVFERVEDSEQGQAGTKSNQAGDVGAKSKVGDSQVGENKVDGSLRVSVTMPAVAVGVVGGGTGLPSQSQARSLIRFGKPVSAEFLAGVVGATVLAAEISGMAALASHGLTTAHQELGR